MPSATKYVPATSQDRNVFTLPIAGERSRRRTAYRKAIDYYNGTMDKQLTGDEDEFNTYINMVKMTADRTISFLFPELPEIELDPESIEPTPDEVWIKKALDANGGLSFLTKLGLRGFLSGHNFVKIIPQKPYPKLVSLDPNTVSIFWRADDINDVLWYEVRYFSQGRVVVQDFVKVEPELWYIITYRSRLVDTDAIGQVSGNVGEANAYGMDYIEFSDEKFEIIELVEHNSKHPPIIAWAHYPNPDDIYGAGEASQKDLQDLINRIASERNRIIRENSDPVDVVIGADADEVDASGSIYSIANPAADVKRLTMQGDVLGLNTVLDKLIETYLSIARVVLLKGEAKDLQRVTNASVRTLFLDALSKNKVLQDNYTRGLKHIILLMLEIAYYMGEIETNPEDREVDVKYASPLPVDMTEVINIVNIALSQELISKRTGTTLIGQDPNFENKAKEAERKEAQEHMKEQQALLAETELSNSANNAALDPPANGEDDATS